MIEQNLSSDIRQLSSQIGRLRATVTRLDSTIDRQIEESQRHNETAKIQAENIARLVDVVNTLVSRN